MKRVFLTLAILLFTATPSLSTEVSILIGSEHMPETIPQQFREKLGVTPQGVCFECIQPKRLGGEI